jgi:aminoglycoside phosphotransferase (APT) family kinase protein
MPTVDAPVHQMAEMAYQQALVPFLNAFGDHLSPKMRVITENLSTHIVDLQHAGSGFPRTVLHGDFRLDNLFFDASSVAVIDWQIACRGQGVFDVAYFLSGCLEPAVRRAEEMRLLRLWHGLVTAGGEGRFSFEDALVDYRRSVLYCNLYNVIAIGSLDAANERGMAVFKRWLQRRGAAIEELDAGELMPR